MKRLVLVFAILFLMVFTVFPTDIVAITAIVEHPALDAVREGVIDELKDSGLVEGVDFEVRFQSAQGSMNTAVSIAQHFLTIEPDVVVAIATPSAQACVNVIKDIPVVFSAVTDPIAASLIEDFGFNSGNVVGISDMTPVLTQFKLIKLIDPNIETVGIIFNPGETNSAVITEFAKEACQELGMELIEITGSTAPEMISSLNALISDVDALYVGTDNTAASSIKSIGSVARNNKVPLIAADIDVARGGGMIGFGFNYYSVGRETGKIVFEILQGKEPSEIESKIVGSDSLLLYVDIDLAEELGITLPESLIDRADILVMEGVEITGS
ncbi:MAG: ABC transporter substrate-binding protein [Kosmotoga sp.]|nr:MAG: ABC transporter substrate-binding protein [Kosmotoga sp.]